MSAFSRMDAYRQDVRDGGPLPSTETEREKKEGEGFRFPFLGEHKHPVPSL